MNDSNDIHWFAFRYIAGELTADEGAAFELQLADDQAAREAVAEAVELTQLIAAAEVRNTAPVIRTARPVAMWFSLAAAACVLLLFSLQLPSRNPQSTNPTDNLASAWSEQLETDDSGELANLSDDTTDDPLTDVPGWMVEAIRSLHDEEDENAVPGDEILES